MIRKFLRVTVGLLLICMVFPPVSLGVLNVFVLVPVGLGAILLLLPVILGLLKRLLGRRYKGMLTAACIALAVAAGVYLTEFGFILAGGYEQTAPVGAVVIVPGAGVHGTGPTMILLGRIQTAGDYLVKHPDAVCIATGGKGAGEDITEADCIKKWLIDHYNIAPERLFTEETSTSTSQNIDNAKVIIEQHHLSKDVVIATDSFHLFRAKLLASRRGLTPYGLPAQTDWRLAPQLYIRELIGLPKSLLFNR